MLIDDDDDDLFFAQNFSSRSKLFLNIPPECMVDEESW